MVAAKKAVQTRDAANESEMIRRILAGERELYYDLVAPYERMVYVSVVSVLRSEAGAEDCAQEAFLKAFRSLAEFKGESKFSSWLVRIALNEAKMQLRKLRPEMFEPLDKSIDLEEGEYVPQILGDWREIPSEALERKEVRAMLENAIRSLSDKYREVFVLRDVQNLNIATTAQMLGITEGVVKTRLLRARLQLRDLLFPVLKDSNVLSRQAFRKGKNPWL
jgi:RNA polymerase sigma-70 factor (ECF subfamily)